MHAKTVKIQCTFARIRAINKLFHMGRYIGRFIARYRVIYRAIFQISAVFCCKWYSEWFFLIVSAAGKKGGTISRPSRTIFKTGVGRCRQQSRAKIPYQNLAGEPCIFQLLSYIFHILWMFNVCIAREVYISYKSWLGVLFIVIANRGHDVSGRSQLGWQVDNKAG